MAEHPALVIEDLTKHFGKIRALEGLSLQVDRGEVLGFLGPNGAGKTTTIRLLLDFIRPTRGRALVFGRDAALPATRAGVGYLPAELRLDPRYTATEVVAFFGQLRGGVDEAYVDTLFDRFDLDATRPVGELSTGNKRKIGIVQAFMHRPQLCSSTNPPPASTLSSNTSSRCCYGKPWATERPRSCLRTSFRRWRCSLNGSPS